MVVRMYMYVHRYLDVVVNSLLKMAEVVSQVVERKFLFTVFLYRPYCLFISELEVVDTALYLAFYFHLHYDSFVVTILIMVKRN